MFTETELRDALRHSADRADAISTPVPTERTTAGVADIAASDRNRHRRWLLPAAAAAAVAALAVGVLAASGDSNGPDGTGKRTAAAPPASSATHRTAAPGPLAEVAVVDRVRVGTKALVQYEIGPAGEPQTGSVTVRQPYGPVRATTLTVASSGSVDAARVQRGTKVRIAGTTGWYSNLKLFPLDGSTGPGSDKWLSHWTIAFRAPNGDWAFASIEKATGKGDDLSDVSVDDPSEIVRRYDSLKATYATDTSRTPLHVGWLPKGLRMVSAYLEFDHGRATYASLSFARNADGDTAVSVQWGLGSKSVIDKICKIPSSGTVKFPVKPKKNDPNCHRPVTKNVAKGLVTIDGAVSVAVQRHVARATTVAVDPADYLSLRDAVTP